jgi:small-conductance mechanosensitive channel
MEQLLEFIKDTLSIGQVVITFCILLLAFILRLIVFKVLNNSKTILRENKRRLKVNTSSFLSFFVMLGLLFIWSSELRSLAFSVAALGVAFVLATKELIASFTGSIYKASNNVCSVGDRIEVNGVRGDIIDRSVLATKLMEIGPGHDTNYYTGRIITIPNSVFLTAIIKNESVLGRFCLHSFHITIGHTNEWKFAYDILLEEAQKECQKYTDEAKLYVDKIQAKNSLETPTIEPTIVIKFNSFEEILLIMRITVPMKNMIDIEQNIKRSFLIRFRPELDNNTL